MERARAAAWLLTLLLIPWAVPAAAGTGRAEQIIFMVPDGMGQADVTAARIFRNGPDGPPLALETLAVMGCQRTHSADSTLTDSAAAASAWAMGEKFNNGELSCHSQTDPLCQRQRPTILELAQARGKSTGLVVSSQISDATPAAFAAHVRSRRCQAEIARQYLAVTGVDVILGGGPGQGGDGCSSYPLSSAWTDQRAALLELAGDQGYAAVTGRTSLESAVRENRKKILGMFGPEQGGRGKTPERFRVDASHSYPADEPTLSEMTAAALAVLERNEKGFFLVVEGSQIDWRNHANDLRGQIAEVLAFDKAVRVVLKWVGARAGRAATTLIIIAPDHETGGFAITGPDGRLARKGEIVADGWTGRGHTATDTLLRSQGPGSENLGQVVDNTDLYGVMADALGLDQQPAGRRSRGRDNN